MATCVTCSTEFPDSLGACPQCRTPLGDVATVMVEGETRMSPETPHPSSDGKAATSATGWLSSSGAIDHGRFPPGTLLGGRYRIVGRLGRGGMGEVYRADDLKLGQPGALTLPFSVISISLILLLMLRFGLLATSVFFVVNLMVGQGVLTLQPGRWFFATSTWTLAAAAAIAAYGFYAARGGEPLIGRRLLD